MIELGLLGVLVFILVYCITLLRRSPEKSEEVFSDPDAEEGKPTGNTDVAATSSGAA
jgi:hypothetical protein